MTQNVMTLTLNDAVLLQFAVSLRCQCGGADAASQSLLQALFQARAGHVSDPLTSEQLSTGMAALGVLSCMPDFPLILVNGSPVAELIGHSAKTLHDQMADAAGLPDFMRRRLLDVCREAALELSGTLAARQLQWGETPGAQA